MTDYDSHWFVGATRYEEALSTWTATAFWVMALGTLLVRVPGRLALITHVYIAVLLLNLGITSFFVHALGRRELYDSPERNPVWVYLDRAAQCWALTQVTIWSMYGLYLPYHWYWVSPVIGYTYQLVLWPRPDADIAFFVTLFGLAIGGALYQEYGRADSNRRRTVYLMRILTLLAFLCVLYIYEGDLSHPLGQFGHTWIHVTQALLLVEWHYFWLQQEDQYFWFALPEPCKRCVHTTAATATIV